MLTLKQVAQWCDGSVAPEYANIEITGISTDTRAIQPGELFIALQEQWRNRTVSDGYEPGSTFKTITLASALEEGAAPSCWTKPLKRWRSAPTGSTSTVPSAAPAIP